ncbi:PEP-CTERM sorting domain-containing protein [Elioraea rosea]|uniref:PEP-CTERM sorting domain-containing protein n=1 Tax=Elioraea rosea TaxID=2492390 RepID=UPI0011832204|nr:PEP-CTERM sorting domain-containing protein [Elioraea rosea]
MQRPLATLIAASCLGLASPSVAAPIVQALASGTVQLLSYPALGQSFTAEDATVSVGFWIQEIRPDIAPAGDSVSITLREGAGASGAVLATATVSGLASGFAGWVDADFSAIALTAGSVYTAVIGDLTPRWSLSFYAADAYAGGQMLFASALQPTHEAKFRVLPVAPAEEEPPIAVPEPAGAGLVGLALAALVAARRRRGG